MTLVSKNLYNDNLADIVDKYHSTTKMKPVDAKSSICINFNKENNKEDQVIKISNRC